MLMGFPNDYWEQEYVDTVMGPFGKAINWGNDPDHLTRLLVRARVVNVNMIRIHYHSYLVHVYI